MVDLAKVLLQASPTLYVGEWRGDFHCYSREEEEEMVGSLPQSSSIMGEQANRRFVPALT